MNISNIKKVLIVSLLFASSIVVSADTITSVTSFNSNLSRGSQKSADIKLLQQFLTDQGLYNGPITGKFYSLTLQAVKNFQVRENIDPVSGYFGSLSRARANEILALQLVAETSSTTEVIPASFSVATNDTAVLQARVGYLYQRVWDLQRRLDIKKPNNLISIPTPTTNSIPSSTSIPSPSPTPTPTPNPAPSPTPTPTPVVTSSSEIKLTAYITGYTYWDNTPPGSADISLPVIHSKAGGTGTWSDPITVAVGHVMSNGKDTPDYPKGTKFYLPNLRRYFIVEDTCGDGNTPQNGPCHNLSTADKGAQTWLDLWIDGKSMSNSLANGCAEAITANYLVVQNPASNYAVTSGSVIGGISCPVQYGNNLVLQ